jgi:hypothetical protein
MKFLRFAIVALGLIAMAAVPAWGWGDANNCVTCHTTFNPNNGDGASHAAHGALVTDCGYCHPDSGLLPVSTNSSRLDPDNSCSGCHTLGGLYAIHDGATSCAPCHTSNPPAPGLESDRPPYYGTAATPYGATRSCYDNLDNDGDGDVDKGDADCANVPTKWRSWSIIKKYYGD